MMQWKKLGLVYSPDGSLPWAQTHAMIPTPVLVAPDRLRVYVTMCDQNYIGRPGFVDVDPENPLKILQVAREPLLDIGSPGAFDENGVLLCSVVPCPKNRHLMYYAGYELGTKIRYRLLTGIAESTDGGTTFKRIKQTPVLERSDSELYFRGGPVGLWDNGIMKLWYVAGSSWTNINGKEMPVYEIKYLESPGGISFGGEGSLCIKIEDEDEHGFGRPWVVKKENSSYQMYYSIRKRSVAAYRLGYAESVDGINWHRKDHLLGLDVTPGSFDSDAIMYAAVISCNDRTYCFYNGNDFGKDGFAVAELIQQ